MLRPSTAAVSSAKQRGSKPPERRRGGLDLRDPFRWGRALEMLVTAPLEGGRPATRFSTGYDIVRAEPDGWPLSRLWKPPDLVDFIASGTVGRYFGANLRYGLVRQRGSCSRPSRSSSVARRRAARLPKLGSSPRFTRIIAGLGAIAGLCIHPRCAGRGALRSPRARRLDLRPRSACCGGATMSKPGPRPSRIAWSTASAVLMSTRSSSPATASAATIPVDVTRDARPRSWSRAAMVLAGRAHHRATICSRCGPAAAGSMMRPAARWR